VKPRNLQKQGNALPHIGECRALFFSLERVFKDVPANENTMGYETVKGKAVPLQAWSGPEGSRKLRFLDYMTTAQDGGKVVSRTRRPPLPSLNAPGTHFR
jgi:hypothetical protein